MSSPVDTGSQPSLAAPANEDNGISVGVAPLEASSPPTSGGGSGDLLDLLGGLDLSAPPTSPRMISLYQSRNGQDMATNVGDLHVQEE